MHVFSFTGVRPDDISQQSSKLSPLAVPFVPKMPAESSKGPTEHSQSLRSNLSVNAPVFVPTSFIPKTKVCCY